MDEFQFIDYPIIGTEGSGAMLEETQKLSFPYGEHTLRQWYFDDIRINHNQTHFFDHYQFENNNRGGVVNLSFNLQGDYKILQNGLTYDVKAGQHNLIHAKGHNNTFFNQKLVGETFDIEFRPQAFYQIAKDGNDTLKKFLDRMLSDEPAVLSQTSLFIHPDLYRAIHSIIHCTFSGAMKKLFFLSKSIEILVLQAEAYDRFLKQKQHFCSEQDQEKLRYARGFVEANLATPPSLSELSKEIGMNEYKLKRGFKELFGTTVFGYLSRIRLEKAKHQLKNTNLAIGEIAFELGYSSSQHFSKAFKGEFGVSPSQFRQLR